MDVSPTFFSDLILAAPALGVLAWVVKMFLTAQSDRDKLFTDALSERDRLFTETIRDLTTSFLQDTNKK